MASAAEISVEEAMVAVGKQARNAGLQLATLDHEQRLKALHAIAEALEANADAIVAANQKDLEAAEGQISSASYNRLKLPKSKLNSAILGVRDVAKLPDPLGAVTLHRKLDENLVLKRFAVPVGVLGIIFESRPDVLIQISCLAIKSGNAVILKGGKESINSCVALGDIIRGALSEAGVDANAVQILTSREEIRGLLELDRYVDLIIPRGSNAFVRYVQTNTRIPVLGHADGICHIFVDEAADRMLEDAAKIVVDSKTQYPSACNAVETLLVCEKVAPEFLPLVGAALHAKGVQLRVCEQAEAILQRAESHLPFEAATPEDWSTEYCDLVLAVRVVPDLVAAMAHIRDYGSRHTECILTSDKAAADRFIAGVDAAGVYWNASTRFADGFRYGFGAEVGISTQKMPPRGPVGLEGLVTYKYSLVGSGPSLGDHVVERYAGDDCRPFLHEDLPLEQADKDEQQQ